MRLYLVSRYAVTLGAVAEFPGWAPRGSIPRARSGRWHTGLDPHLLPILEEHIAHTLIHASAPKTFTEVVDNLITEQVLSDRATAALVAARLNVSPGRPLCSTGAPHPAIPFTSAVMYRPTRTPLLPMENRLARDPFEWDITPLGDLPPPLADGVRGQLGAAPCGA